jgi:hypothetical protein
MIGFFELGDLGDRGDLGDYFIELFFPFFSFFLNLSEMIILLYFCSSFLVRTDSPLTVCCLILI